MEDDSLEKKIAGLLQQKTTRRGFLEKASKGAGVLLAVGAIATLKSECSLVNEELRPPRELPPDILTKEELEKAHIKIYPTPKVWLFLRPGVFNFPLFQDAASGKLDEVGIVLVDGEAVNWRNSGNFPEDARLLFRSVLKNPIEEWRLDKQKQLESEITYWQKEQKRFEFSKADRLRFPTILPNMSEEEAKRKNSEELQRIEAHLEQINQKLKTLSDQEAAIFSQEELPPDYEEATQGMIAGMFLDGRIEAKRNPELIREHPGIERKVFIYVAVGGKAQPRPSQSYPDPEKLKQQGKMTLGYTYLGAGDDSRGFALTHEVGHYDPLAQGPKRGYRSEPQADTSAMQSITEAWDRLQRTENTSGYPFVFQTEEGITITKKRDPQNEFA